MKRKRSFILLTRHTDEELTHFLQKKAEEGWWLEKNRGNRFTFIGKPYEGKRIAAYTFFSRGPESSTEVQIGRELPYLRKQGWDQIGVSRAENIFDSRRHVFLYEEHKTEFFPLTEEAERKKAEKRSERKAYFNFALCVLYTLATIAVMALEKVRLLTSLPYLLAFLFFIVLLVLALFWSGKSVLWALRCHRDRKKETEKGNYCFLDKGVYLTSLMLLFLLLSLIFSSIWGNGGTRGERVTIGGTSVMLYSDTIPLTLSDLGVEAKGEWRTTRLEERNSPIASFTHAYDQSLGGDEKEVKALSYSIFKSPFALLRNIAKSELFPYGATEDKAMEERLGVDEVLLSSSSRVLIRTGESIITINSSSPLGEDELSLFLKLVE